MTIYLWSTLTNGQVINPFNRNADALRFDSGTISAASVSVFGNSTTTTFGFGGKSVTLQLPLTAVGLPPGQTLGNVRFDDGSLLLIGDNTTGTAADHTGGTLTGGAFNDKLMAGAGGYELRGGGGNDVLMGNTGNDVLDGQSGNDNMSGGAGDDEYHVDSSSDVVIESASQGDDHVISSATFTLGANIETLLLSGGAAINGTGNALGNVIQGNTGNNVLRGEGGDDVLQGFAGNDDLWGGAGADSLDGGGSFDWVHYENSTVGLTINMQDESQNTGEAAGDSYTAIEGIFATNFADILIGEDSRNFLHGLSGNDRIEGWGGNDVLFGDAGNDYLEGGAGADQLIGDAGFDYTRHVFSASVTVDLANPSLNAGDAAGDTYVSIEGIVGSLDADSLSGDGGNNDISGLSGNDILFGRDGIDNLTGGNDDDELHGGAGADTMSGGSGEDMLYGDAGADKLAGDAGFDYARYDLAPAAVVAKLSTPAQNTGDAAGDTYSGIEGIIGSAFNDTLGGDGALNQLEGRNGDDLLLGGGGDDLLFGEEGSDRLDGGAGADELDGGNGTDFASYESSASGLVVSIGDSTGNTGDAVGDVYTSIEGVIGSAFADTIEGDSSNNTLRGLAGDDSINGGNGNDTLEGGDNNDVLDGSVGVDSLAGGAGNDDFFFDVGQADEDTVVDFAGNGSGPGDRLIFSGYGTPADGTTFIQLSATRWEITAGDGSIQEQINFLNSPVIHPSDLVFI